MEEKRDREVEAALALLVHRPSLVGLCRCRRVRIRGMFSSMGGSENDRVRYPLFNASNNISAQHQCAHLPEYHQLPPHPHPHPHPP